MKIIGIKARYFSYHVYTYCVSEICLGLEGPSRVAYGPVHTDEVFSTDIHLITSYHGYLSVKSMKF